jgi:histidinol phosphatase-like PHP family hydrolase
VWCRREQGGRARITKLKTSNNQAEDDPIAEAARSSGLAAELNSTGWRKPCAEAYPAPALLSRFQDHGVPITTASDGHELGRVLEDRRSRGTRAI